MRITTAGRGRVGGGLSRRWSAAGHNVTALGRDGGDASGSEVVVVAIPGDAIADGLAKVTGLTGQITIDATNKFGARPTGFESVAQQVKSFTRGPTAKRSTPTSPFCTTRSTRNRCHRARCSQQTPKRATQRSG